jgi:hypothetical protein
MKFYYFLTGLFVFTVISSNLSAQMNPADTEQGKNAKTSGTSGEPGNLYLDVHHFGPGKVKYEDVAKAHARDLAVEKKYGVDFIDFWVDENRGTVYCLSSTADSASILKTHSEAHGLLPDQIYLVTSGHKASSKSGMNYFIDVHELGAGNVTAKAVAEAHQKDLATQKKYDVNFINYWVNEKEGIVVCLSQAPDSNSIINTHREAHGLLPAYVEQVKTGNK